MKKLLCTLTVATSLFAAIPAIAYDMPKESAAAPGFTLPSQDGKDVSLNQFQGKWVVLYFYPKDFTSGCSLEAHTFQSDIKKYEERNAVIVGVSVDTPDSHKQFCTKEGLDFKLLADTGHTVIHTYGAVKDFKGTEVASRSTFLIDPKGVIRKVYPKVDAAGHSAEVLADLDKLK